MAQGVDEIVKNAQELIVLGKLDVADELLTDTIRILNTTDICPKDTDTTEYKSFFKPIEEVLYYHLFKPEKEVQLTGDDYSSLYRTYGRLLIEKKEFEQAKGNLIKSIRWNPMNLTAKFEYAESYRCLGNMDMFAAINAEILKYAYHVRAISRAYANLAIYFFDSKKIDIAIALIYVAMELDKNFEGSKSIFDAISENGKRTIKKPNEKTIKKLFSQNSIQLGVSDEIVSVLYSYGLHYAKLGQYRSAGYFLKYSYGLSADPAVLRMLKILPDN